MSTLRDEIAKCIHKMHPEFYHNNEVADEILKLIQNKIDSIEPLDDIEYLAGHVGFEDAKNKMKELLSK